MDILVFSTCMLTIVLLAMSLLVVWVRRDGMGWFRTLSIVAALLCGLVAFGSEFSVIGRPTVIVKGINFPDGKKVPLLGFKVDDGKAIYVMLDVPGEPMLYRLPWNKQQAQQMEMMQQRGQPMEAGQSDSKAHSLGSPGDETSQGIQVTGRPDPRDSMSEKKTESSGTTLTVGG